MRLLIIARPFVFHGGVEHATAGLVQALVEHGYDVHLASPPGQPPMRGATLHRLSLPPLPAVGRVLALAAAARRLVARGGWDVVQSHERTLCQQIYRAGEGCHRAYLASRDRPAARGLYHRVVLALERRVFERTPRIVAIARAGKREIETLYHVHPGRVSVVYNGVDLERFHPRKRAALRPAARAEAGIPTQAWAVLFVGSGFERKGLAAAIEALAALGDRASRLLVVGKGDTAPYGALAARLGVAERVIWLGPRPDIERWYAAADVCVLPTRYEPFGNVHLEALASGLAVVTSALAGGSEVVRPGVNGAVTDPRDPRDIAAALQAVRDLTPSRAAEMAAAARASAEPFTYAAQVAALGRLYAECVPGKANLS
jgi:UDP-glucose:(heptosyl)LPS alpha-1,3-glucosyltransferase